MIAPKIVPFALDTERPSWYTRWRMIGEGISEGKDREMAKAKVELKKIKELVIITLIGVYMTQKMGKPTHKELQQAIKDKLKASIHTKTLQRAMQGAAKGDFIAIHRPQVEGGTTETAYAMKNLSWKNAPEYAHINDLLPVLMATAEAQEIKDWFDGQEGNGQSKKKRGNIVDDYRAVRFKCVTIDELLGSQIPCQATDAVRKAFPTNIEKDGIEVEGIFQRCPVTGDFIIPQDVLQGWFASNALRYMGLAEVRAAYVAFSSIRIQPKGDVQQLVLPVISARGPSAPKAYEMLPPGQEFEIKALVPTKGLMTLDEFERIILTAGLRPKRGISPARGRRYGRFLVTEFTDFGSVVEGDLSFLASDIPSPLMEEHGSYFQDAIQRLGNLPDNPAVVEPGEFPGGGVEEVDAQAA